VKIYVSADMEFASGITSLAQVSPGNPRFEEGRRLWMADLQSLVEGALAGGATEVLINEAHALMDNLDPDEVHPAAQFISGYGKAGNQMEGLDSGFDLVFLLTHARAGGSGTLSHTYMLPDIICIRLNGQEVGELGLNALWAGRHDVPVGLVAGDDATVREACELLGDVEAVVTKESLGQFTAKCLAPAVCRERLKRAAATAVRRVADFNPLRRPGPFEMDITFTMPAMAAFAAFVPGVERVDPLTIRFSGDDYDAVQRTRIATTNLARVVALQVRDRR
jgi:D-amino peptidase